MPRAAHRGEGGITAEFNSLFEFRGTSLREQVQGKPWEQYVRRGERAFRERDLERRGLEPLIQANLVAQVGAYVLSLPYKLVKWPVPYLAI